MSDDNDDQRRGQRSVRASRGPLLAVLDVTAWTNGPLAASLLLGQSDAGIGALVVCGLAAAITVLGANMAQRVYTPRWPIGSLPHIRALSIASASGGAVLYVAALASGLPDELRLSLIAAALAIVLSFGARVTWREWSRSAVDRIDTEPSSGPPLLIFGAGSAGKHVCRELMIDPDAPFHPVAMLDDDALLRGREINRVVVEGGRDEIAEVAHRHRAHHLLVAIPSASSPLVRDVTRRAEQAGLEVLVLPSIGEMVRVQQPSVSDIREVTLPDLLGRRPVAIDLEQRGAYVSDEVVLVTGAGGSIGSELCRQLVNLGPRTLLMLDRDESALHALQLSIEGRAMLESDQLVVADIRDEQRMRELFERWRPSVIFHAAALKHLPLLELHPAEGFKTNTAASHGLLELAGEFGVNRFVNISTDKAADPTSVLGYTKRMAERLTASAAERTGRTFMSVRFGNVLGSRGSVLESFTAQIANGGPVTVTDPSVDRYFMTVEEAVSLVIAAGDAGRAGEVMILDMGEPVSILSVAERLIAESGRDVTIEFTGLRAGEKLHEELIGADEVLVRDPSGLMWHGACPPLQWAALSHLGEITDDHQLVRAMRDLVGIDRSEPVPEAHAGGFDIWLSPPNVGAAERSALLRAFDSGWVAPAGPELDAFEAELCATTGAEAALAVSSGTAALHLALTVSGVGPGDDVVVQTATFAATAFAVHLAGATPVFCDIDRDTMTLDPQLLAVLLAERARTGLLPKAVMPVDIYGRCADYERLREVCDPFGVMIVQDAAESLGSRSQGRCAGTHGDLGIVSFNGNKIITTSGGGALLGPADAIDRARVLSTQAREPVPHYEHRSIGFNYRMSNLLAAMGRAQLADLDFHIERRTTIADRYRAGLPELDWLPVGVTERSNHWLSVGLLPDGIAPDVVCAALAEAGIEARPAWFPMHRQPVFETNEAFGGEVAEELFDRGICLPSGSGLGERDQDRVIEHCVAAIRRTTRTSAA